MCSSSGESVVSIRHLAYVTLTVWYAGMDGIAVPSIPAYQTGVHRVTYARCRIDTIDSPDDEHMVARNM